jgi:S-adenosylmethionine:tRNA ribosyltransferase-isomerase
VRVSDFDFDLPEDRIALEPARPRDAARLLLVDDAGLDDRIVNELPELLRPGDLLVVNDTRVIPAQLRGARPPRASGGASETVEIDVMLHQREADESGGAVWRAFVRPAKRLRPGDALEFGAGLSARVAEREDAEARLLFNARGDAFDIALARAGLPPLPPYIARRRAVTVKDAADYQTVYASERGSVAAPTAGLHFTDDLLAALDARGVGRVAVTLHVGAGTFLPVSSEDTEDHRMHPEWGEVTVAQAAAINAARAAGGRVVAVGTTALRLLESACDSAGRIQPFAGETALFITPGYRVTSADILMTNFHLPRSTLFMLVCAFAGTERMRAAYAHAIASGYRFYSYGDACLIELAAR